MEKLEELKEFLLEHKIYWIGGIILCLFLLIGIVYYDHQSSSEEILLEEIEPEKTEPEKEEKEDCLVSVDMKGEVQNPGPYQLKCDSRVQDAILLAGGVTDQADTSVLNLSKKVTDEMVIIVYSIEEVKSFSTIKEQEKQKEESCQKQEEVFNDACVQEENKVESSSVVEEKETQSNLENSTSSLEPTIISLNQATLEQLMSLSGIGESKAKSIIEYRNQNGGFQSIEEIKNVKGIGEKIFEKIKDYLTL